MNTKNTQSNSGQRRGSGPHIQRGYATLIMAMVILFALTLITIYAGKVTVTELNTSSNEARTKEAQAAAEEAVDRTVAYLNRNRGDFVGAPGKWKTCPNVATPDTDDPSIDNFSYFPCGDDATNIFPTKNPLSAGQWIFYRLDSAEVADLGCNQARCLNVAMATQDLDSSSGPDARPIVYIVAEGESNDHTARAIVRQAVVLTPSDSSPVVDAPLVAAGEIGGGGTFDVVANPNAAGKPGVSMSVWSGSNFTAQGDTATCHLGEFLSSDSGYMDIPYVFEGVPRTYRHCAGCRCPNGEGITDAHVSAGADAIDVLDVDGNAGANQDAAFPDDVFQYLFGVPESEYQQVKDAAEGLGHLITSCGELPGPRPLEVIQAMGDPEDATNLWWYEGAGDCVLDHVGDVEAPILLIVENSEVRINASKQVYGLIFAFDPAPVSGASAVHVTGGATLVGALLSNRQIDFGGGNMVVRFDPYVLSQLGGAASLGPAAGKLPGTWADFRLVNN